MDGKLFCGYCLHAIGFPIIRRFKSHFGLTVIYISNFLHPVAEHDSKYWALEQSIIKAQIISLLVNAPPVHVDIGHLVTLLHPFHVSFPQFHQIEVHSYPEIFFFEHVTVYTYTGTCG